MEQRVHDLGDLGWKEHKPDLVVKKVNSGPILLHCEAKSSLVEKSVNWDLWRLARIGRAALVSGSPFACLPICLSHACGPR